MNANPRNLIVQDALTRYRAGRIDRRQALRILGGVGITGVAAVALLGRPETAARMSAPAGHGGHGMLAQGGTPEAEMPPPVATPQLGEQPDGAYVWRVQVGGFSEEDLIDVMAFLPEEITINAGDSIFFDVQGFHTVTFPSGEEPPRLFILESALGSPTAGATPTADAAEGGRIVLNPAGGFPVGGNTYDGTGYVNSGIPDPSAPPFTLTFTQPGTYEYLCLVHPAMMKARVVVQDQGAERANDQGFYDQQAAEQLEAIIAEGRALIEQQTQATPEAGAAEGNVWEVTAGVGEGHAQVLRFLPQRLEIKVGDTVRWVNRAHSEPHTVTFVGGEEPPEFILIEPQADGPPLIVLNPQIMQQTGGETYDGEGYANSGWLQEESPEMYVGFEGPHTYELTFEAPGEFPYYCAIHAGGPDDEHGMVGTIAVT